MTNGVTNGAPGNDSEVPAGSSIADASPRGVSPLTREQEAAVLSHIPIVRAIARRIHERLPRHVSLDDLCGAGTVGLLDAVKRYNPRKEVLFRSYAQFRIRGAILDSIRALDWSPRNLRRRERDISGVSKTLCDQMGRMPTQVEMASALQIDINTYQKLLGQLDSLKVGHSEEDHAESFAFNDLDNLPARYPDDPLSRYLEHEMQGRLTEAVNNLGARQRVVMTLYYYEELTMKEIGTMLGVAECTISQIHASGLSHLRSVLLGGDAAGKHAEIRKATRQRNKRVSAANTTC